MSRFEAVKSQMQHKPRRWLVTGAAGFIGSHLTEQLLNLGQQVVGVDNFATGSHSNIDLVLRAVGKEAAQRFLLVEADVSKAEMLSALPVDIDIVLHQAALGSVPRSIENPVASHQANVTGFLNLLEFCRARKLRLVYASSSSVYGDHPALPKHEGQEGRLLSPYAATKAINETYAQVWSDCYSLETIGLRYFNVFGPRQDPSGAYAAVIPRWLAAIMNEQPCTLNGDGETSRDFCYVKNVVQANLLAAYAPATALGKCYNIACGERTTLRQLHDLLWTTAKKLGVVKVVREPIMQAFRAGDVRHSLASIALAQEHLGFEPSVRFAEGIAALVQTQNDLR